MKRLHILLIALSLSFYTKGQSLKHNSFTLDQCIQFALDNSIRAKNALLDQKIAAAKVNETIGLGLPQISGTASLVNNPQLPRFFTTWTGTPGFSGDLSNVPGIKPGDAIAAANFFQLKNTGSASVTLNQLIFNGSYIVGLKAASTFKDLSIKTTEQTQQDIIHQVTKAFYAVLINKERTKLFDNNLGRVDSLLKNTIALNKNGFAESIDVDRVKVTLNNLRAERDKFTNLNELGLQLLKFQMNYSQDQPIDVVGNIGDVHVDSNIAQLQDGFDYRKRPDYRVMEVNYRLQQLNLKNQYAGAVPVISAFGTLGYSTGSPDFAGLFKTNSAIADQGGLGPDKWYKFSQLGLSLNVPIFTGLSRSYRIQQEKLKLVQMENTFINLKNAIDFEIAQASISFENAILSLAAQKENQDLAGNVARVTKIKYEQGVGSSFEVTDAENSLRTAQTNYYSALFDAMVAKVDLDKAYGKLLPSNYEENNLINPEKK